jgi:Putative amidoligase enzyme
MTDHFQNTFSVEIECLLPVGASQQAAATAVAARLTAAGFTSGCRPEPLNKQIRTYWKIVPDGSLHDIVRGAEFVSPILRGENGLREIDVVCRALQDFGCSVNRNCGLHTHIGVGQVAFDFFKSLVKLYAAFEPVIDTLVPPSRRASASQWCRSMTSARAAMVDATHDLRQLINVATPGGKYSKVNLLPYNRQKTVEFRQHSGSLDSLKINNWVVLCLRMVAKAKTGHVNLGSGPSINRARPGSKAYRIGEMFLRPQGVTGQEVCREMGWPSVSMPVQARAAGIEFTTQRVGRQVRYFARAAQETQMAAPITLDGLCQTLGSTDEEKQFLQRRAADLGGPVAWAA